MMKPIFQEAYEKGARRREETLQNTAPDHQKHIETYWKNAVTDWIASEKAFREPIDSYTYHDHVRRHGRAPVQTGEFSRESVFTVHHRSLAFPCRHVVGLDDDACCDIIRFLAMHFDWPPEKITEEIRLCCDTVSRKRMGPEKGGCQPGPWAKSAFFLLGILFLVLLLTDIRNSPFSRGLLAVSFPFYLAAFLCARKAAQSKERAIRTAADPVSALDGLCELYRSPLVRYDPVISRAAGLMPLLYLAGFVIQRFLSARGMQPFF